MRSGFSASVVDPEGNPDAAYLMRRWHPWGRGWVGVSLLVVGLVGLGLKVPAAAPVVLVVMDPLARELACACVQGFGQRDYRKLASLLERDLGEKVGIEFSDDLAATVDDVGPDRELVIVGERSEVERGARLAGMGCLPVMELTGQEGDTTVTGLFVARRNDPLTRLQEVRGRQVIFGFPAADAKYGAAMATLRAAGIELGADLIRHGTAHETALDLVDSTAALPPVAVLPSYVLRLMEGCGSIKKGDLRVLGTTEPVPFITVFLGDRLAPAKKRRILETLLGTKEDAELLKAMESRDGFRWVSLTGTSSSSAGTGAGAGAGGGKPMAFVSAVRAAVTEWPDWRGPERNGRVPRLPERLPDTVKVVWKRAGVAGALAGLSVAGGRLLLAERDLGDEQDVYRCLEVTQGNPVWRVAFPAPGKLDYGTAPRATPVIREGRAYLQGAMGELRCVDVTDGRVLWKRDLPRDFEAQLPEWGLCSTPLLVEDLVIVNPGGAGASLVALDQATGRTRWTSPGRRAAYASFIVGEFGGRRQIVGYDQGSLGGWDIRTGKRLWELVPPRPGDFNVPTPLAVEGGLVVSTENNGTRWYRFDDTGRILPQPAAVYAEPAADSTTPVATCGRVFEARLGLRCLDLAKGLKPVWTREDDSLGDYATLIADDERVLVITLGGELILLDGRSDDGAVLSRLRVFEEEVEIYSHPALVGSHLFIRGGSSVVCVDLGTDGSPQ